MPFSHSSLAHPGAGPKPARLLYRARRRLSWLALAACAIALVGWLTLTQALWRADRALTDSLLDPVRPAAADEIVIVAIDDKSLQAVGRWPWRRALHAEVLRRIAQGEPRCIGLDLLLDDANAIYPEDDLLLAASMKTARCVVLPMAAQRGAGEGQAVAEVLPTPPLARAATALGHAHLAIDGEGDVRGAYLSEGLAGREWPQFSLALYQAANGTRAPQPPLADDAQEARSGSRWRRQHEELLVYNAPARRFQTVSYIDLLRGEVSPEVFHGRYVLIGPTAETIADMFALPSPDYLVPGVEFFAQMLQAFVSGRHVRPAAPWQDLACNLLPLSIVLLAVWWLSPARVLGLVAILLLAMAGLQTAQPWTGIRFSTAAGMSGLLLVYPAWSLMRLDAAYRFLRRGARELDAVLAGMVSPAPPCAPAAQREFLAREIDATSTAVQRVRNLHRFVRDAVDHLPDPCLMLGREGRVFMANRAAERHWGRDCAALAGEDAHGLLCDLRLRHNGQPMLPPGALASADGPAIVGEGEDAAGRTILLRCVPFLDADNAYAGWMVALVDLSEMRRTQAQRDEALRFIAHDIREPSAAILTVVELSRASPAALPPDVLLQRIEQQARTGLALADGFVNLARAEAQAFRPEPLDLVELAMQAVDNAWAGANRRGILVDFESALEEAPLVGDRDLLSRALANLLSNALKFSPVGGRVTCTVAQRGPHWTVAVQDEGPGVPQALQAKLFLPFHRLHQHSHPEVPGVGLGLLLVRTTMQRHGGSVEVRSAEGEGCTFVLAFPRPGTDNPATTTSQP